MKHSYVCAMDWLYRVAVWLSAIAITVMSLIIPWGVFSRYVLGKGSDWPEPIAILLMMVFTFIGTSAAYRAGGHIAVTSLVERLPSVLRKVSNWFIDASSAALCVFVVWYGVKLSMDTWRQGVVELPWLPVGVTYLPISIGAFFTLLFVIERRFFGSAAQRLVVTGEAEAPLTAKEA